MTILSWQWEILHMERWSLQWNGISIGNCHRSASPRPTTLEKDRELFVNFSLILCLWFEIQDLRAYNFFDWISNTEWDAFCQFKDTIHVYGAQALEKWKTITYFLMSRARFIRYNCHCRALCNTHIILDLLGKSWAISCTLLFKSNGIFFCGGKIWCLFLRYRLEILCVA